MNGSERPAGFGLFIQGWISPEPVSRQMQYGTSRQRGYQSRRSWFPLFQRTRHPGDGELHWKRLHPTGQVRPCRSDSVSLADYGSRWTDWFTSLSSLFLSCKTARLLVLAGTERLDRELMIGQMQGKFQLEVISGVGHMLHEVRSFWPVDPQPRCDVNPCGLPFRTTLRNLQNSW